jgi:hypothetical protein
LHNPSILFSPSFLPFFLPLHPSSFFDRFYSLKQTAAFPKYVVYSPLQEAAAAAVLLANKPKA